MRKVNQDLYRDGFMHLFGIVSIVAACFSKSARCERRLDRLRASTEQSCRLPIFFRSTCKVANEVLIGAQQT